jgi:hypothetical protein
MPKSHYGLIAPSGERRTQYLREVIKTALEEIPRYNVPTSVTTELTEALSLEIESAESVQALTKAITRAAYGLRMTGTASLVACDLEDALIWDTDPEKCSHPYRNPLSNGGTICRHCETDLTDAEEMGN